MTVAGILATIAAGTAMADTGWVQDTDGWHFYASNGNEVTDTWKQSGDNWFYLGSDGVMVTDSLIEDNDNYYYVDEYGTKVNNTWKYLQSDSSDGEYYWYYFGANGKAYKQGSNSNTASLKEIDGKKYIFDSEGHMQYGWIGEDGVQKDDDDDSAWQDAMYYAGDENDGAVVTNDWKQLDVENEDGDDDYPGYYWFYFKNNGKKVVSEESYTVNGKKYAFDEYGAMKTDWSEVNKASSSVASGSTAYKHYATKNGDRSTGWFQAVPDEDIDSKGYDDGELAWYYAKSNGDVYKSVIKTISGKKYGFDEYGKMLTGIRAIKTDGATITDVSDKLEDIDEIKSYDGTDWSIYCFDDNGTMAKNTKTLKIDGESYNYKFAATGEGKNGIFNGSIYVNGRRLEADKDKGLDAYNLTGEKDTTGYLVNTSGKIQKNAKNKKDKDEMYWSSDSEGFVTYYGNEKEGETKNK